MQMAGRPMAGNVLVDPPPADDQTLRERLSPDVDFVQTPPPKAAAPGLIYA
jgi:hypothetical protein